MADQLRLFKITKEELEQKANLMVMLDLEIIGLETQLKEAQKELRESSYADVVKDIKAQVKDAKLRYASIQSDLRAAAKESM